MTAAAAQAVDHLMASDCRHPWGYRLFLIPSLPLQMDGQQRLLYDIFDIGAAKSQAGKAAAHQCPQERCQRLQQAAIGNLGKTLLGTLLIVLGIFIVTGLDKRSEALLVDLSPTWLTNLTTQF
jgi:cytochrome c-type biogenesis protein